ncbi:MAG: ATP synthase F1 subunit delta [Longimicrobiales bacterium]
MQESTVARSYASALFELGRRTGEAEALGRALDRIAGLVESDRRIRDFLRSPKIDAAAKKSALTKALGASASPHFLNFLKVMIDKRRQALLPQVASEYTLMLDEHMGRLNAQVTLAHEPDEREEEDIAARLSELLGKAVVPHIRVDRNILGGIVVRFGDRVLDGSLRRRLMALRSRMLESTAANPVS